MKIFFTLISVTNKGMSVISLVLAYASSMESVKEYGPNTDYKGILTVLQSDFRHGSRTVNLR